ncbi:LysM peptidoglycan-binding domain-containing protein [candidate division KSB1 bacterium]|nr:LysM peptidoglycan-binding domain-containing protein [candidate division KSB1 bacterium]
MKEIFPKSLNYLKIPKYLIIFISGMLIGSILTYIAIQIPRDIETAKQDTSITIEKPEFDPFAKFDIPHKNRIESKIRYYIRPGRKLDLVEKYKRSGRYLPMIKAIFEEYNLPQVLVFLPILESGFLPESRSRAGAVGLWQLMPATASDYGLKYSRWIDERRDPEKSTIVAAEMLRFLYDEFGNWELALAAYNSGYNKIKRAIRREKISNYWELKRIPRETRNFVPNFYAILHLLADPKQYGLKLPEISDPIDYETIDLEATFSLEQIAKLANVSTGVIKRFNPALINNIAPSGKYTLKVPIGVKEHFLEQYKENPPERIEFTYTTYRVRKGDTLYRIARKFGTTIKALKAENNLRSIRWIKVGQLLRVASVSVLEESEEDVDVESGYSTTPSKKNQVKFVYKVKRDSISIKTLARYYSVTIDEIKKFNPWLQKESLQKGAEVVIYKPANNITMHKIRRGDSLWRLARKYNTSVANLKRWNRLYGSRIYPGQRLIVKVN